MEKPNENFDKKRKIIHDYNSTSSFYDKRYNQIQKEKYEIILNNFTFHERLILDAGCGTGLLLEYILSLYEQKDENDYRYVGIDISWDMLKAFDSKLRKLTNKINVNLILSDIENLPLRNNVFHSIFSITTIQNLSNKKLGMKSLIRVGKDRAELNLSILKKKLNLREFIEKLIKPNIINPKIISNNRIEDIIIRGRLLKH